MLGFLAFVMTLVLGILVVAGGLRWLWGNQGEALPRPDTDRFDRIESALTALESRIDNLADQQRFLERLLAERPDQRSLGSGEEPEPRSPDVDSVLFDTDEGEEAGDR